MKPSFYPQALSPNVLLTNELAQHLYHTYAKDMPVIDYHTHLRPEEMLENKVFEDLGELWLAHDHYKWTAMRTFGISEKLITGDASYYDKFMAFAEIFPKLVGNPLYLWCCMELKQYFGVSVPLGPDNAQEIYETTKEIIHSTPITPLWCLEQSGVTMVSTTDDPLDDLADHKALAEKKITNVKVWPAFRADRAYNCQNQGFSSYVSQLATVAEMPITSFSDLMNALENRLVYFKSTGTIISDNGLNDFAWHEYTLEKVEDIFTRALAREPLSATEVCQYQSAYLVEIGKRYHKHGFIMQLHAGGYTANTTMQEKMGFPAGFGTINDPIPVESIGHVLNELTQAEAVPKTILYPLNATQIESYASLAASFCTNSTPGHVQLGAPWWFSDQVYGIQRQFEAVSNLYPISLSVGMLTDSRSFIAYPRHDVYRRLLCQFFSELILRGEYFSSEEELGEIIQDICYTNAKKYFNL